MFLPYRAYHNCDRHGHRYVGRYDTKFPSFMTGSKISVRSSDDIEALQEKTYVKDVCTRCGNAIKR